MTPSTNTPNLQQTESRFPEFTRERAKYLAEELCGDLGFLPEACERLIELINGIMGECKTPAHQDDHDGGMWAIRTAYIYTLEHDKHFRNWMKGKGGEDEAIN